MTPGKKTVANVGISESLINGSMPIGGAIFYALEANTDCVFIGKRPVVATSAAESGFELAPGDVYVFDTPFDLGDYAVDVRVADEGVRWVSW